MYYVCLKFVSYCQVSCEWMGGYWLTRAITRAPKPQVLKWQVAPPHVSTVLKVSARSCPLKCKLLDCCKLANAQTKDAIELPKRYFKTFDFD